MQGPSREATYFGHGGSVRCQASHVTTKSGNETVDA